MKKLAPLTVLLLLSVVVTGCHHGRFSQIQGNGKRQLEKRQVPAFSSISTNGAFTIEVTCQKDQSLEVEGDENVLDFVKTEVSGNILRVDNSQNYSVSEPVRVRISVPNLDGLSVNGAGHIDVKAIKNDKFEIDTNGAPSITVAGTTKMVDIAANGAGKVDTQNLHATRAVVDTRGVAKIDLDVSDQLDVEIFGPSSVTYSGNPSVNKNIHGPGKLTRKGGEGA
jgi:hypothetical protein